MIKKIFYSLAAVAAVLLAGYFLQPVKKGKGLNANVAYELVSNWPQLPKNVTLGNPTGLGIDTNQNIVVFHRAGREWPLLGSMPDKPIAANTILIIDKNNGRLLKSWGANLFIMPHGLTVDGDNNIWVTDVGLNQVFKFSGEGKLLLTLGEARVAGRDSLHFDKPTDVAVAKDGGFYVSDGYGNSRIIKFSPAGKFLLEWGSNGNKEGEFKIPHAVCLDGSSNVYVADRENNRIQKFDSSGRFVKMWTDDSFGAMCAVFINRVGPQLVAVDDFTFLKWKHRGSDVFIFDTAGGVQTRFGRSGSYKGPLSWYHDLVVDDDENIYVGDIAGNTIQKFKKVIRR